MTKAKHNGRRKTSALGKTGAERSAHVMNPKYLAEMERFRLMDDTFMSKCLENAPECIELILQIILGKKDLKVVKSQTEYPIKSLQGRGVRFDVFARDSKGKEYDIEIQRAKDGAEPKRARYNSASCAATRLKCISTCSKGESVNSRIQKKGGTICARQWKNSEIVAKLAVKLAARPRASVRPCLRRRSVCLPTESLC